MFGHSINELPSTEPISPTERLVDAGLDETIEDLELLIDKIIGNPFELDVIEREKIFGILNDKESFEFNVLVGSILENMQEGDGYDESEFHEPTKDEAIKYILDQLKIEALPKKKLGRKPK